ncbi:uncharacterized protein [Halyomorpha halys]|uniref:uncharacterized protein n=1 Tax=Halyomorpha halys TaxID=286706 RepID=UPI0006D4F7DB|nr:uncharacterized protein LOC106679305 [Halyomorpha halys]
MSEELESVDETISEVSFVPEEWIKWFDSFKDEKGEWIVDNLVLKEITDQLLIDKKGTAYYSSEDVGEEKTVEETEEEQADSDEESPVQDPFQSKLVEFTEFAKEFLKCKRSTVGDCNRPYRASNPKFWFYKEFREYLENQGFLEKMIEVLVKMFAMHPELPDKPLAFIRDNYDISQKEEDRLIAEWTAITEEMVMLEDEGKALEKRIKWRLKQPREEDSGGSVCDVWMTESHDRLKKKKRQPLVDEKAEASSDKESSPFHWVDSDPISVPSSPSSSLRQIASEVTLNTLEEEPQKERSVTPPYQYDFKETDESSLSLDVGSIELE